MPNKHDSSKDGGSPKKRKGKETPPTISTSEKSIIQELLRSAFNDYAVRYESKMLERADVIEKIIPYLSEYLSAFMVIGYDMRGQPLNILQATSQMDADALSAALNKFLFNIHNNNET
jgi:hypothetical protein